MRWTIFLVAVVSLAAVLPVGGQEDKKATYDEALKYLNSNDPVARAFGLFTLGIAGKEAGPASREIIAALTDPNADVRKQAATTLTAVNPTLATPVLILAQSDDYAKRMQAMQDLSKLGKDASAAVPALVAFLNQAKDSDKAKVIQSLTQVGATDKKLTALMTTWALTSTDPAVRDAALQGLPKMAGAADQVGAALKVLQNDASVQNRLNAAGVLGALAKDSREARQALESLTGDKSPQISGAAKKALTQLKEKK